MPIQRRLPKRGFTNPGRVEYQVVTVGRLAGARGRHDRGPRRWLAEQRLVRAHAAGQAAGRRRARGRAHGARGRRERGRAAETIEAAGGTRRDARAEGRGLGGPRDMLEKLRNIFQIPELKRRILFTLALFVDLPARASTCPTPGVNATALAAGVRAARRGHAVRAVRPVRGRRLLPRDDLRAGHHAVHPRLDHPAAARRGGPVLREAAQGGRGGPEEDHPVHALRHGAASRSSSPTPTACSCRTSGAAQGIADRAGPGLRLHS